MLSSPPSFFHALFPSSSQTATVVTAALASVALTGAGIVTAGVVGLAADSPVSEGAAGPPAVLGPAPAAVSSGMDPKPSNTSVEPKAESSSKTPSDDIPADSDDAAVLPDYPLYPPMAFNLPADSDGAGQPGDEPAPGTVGPKEPAAPKIAPGKVLATLPAAKGTGQTVVLAQTNIPNRNGNAGMSAGLRQVTGVAPDFVTLNEMSKFSTAQIEGFAPGYRAYRAPLGSGADRNQALGTSVMWRAAGWEFVDGGRIQIVNDDRTTYQGRAVQWDRFATWVTLESKTTAAVVSIISTHHMTNPGKYGPNMPLRQRQYGDGMDRLVDLVQVLSTKGEVLVGGDFNTHASQRQPWTAASKMSAAGFSWMNQSVDFLFHRPSAVLTDSCVLTHPARVSDHAFPVAQFTVGQGAPKPAGLRC